MSKNSFLLDLLCDGSNIDSSVFFGGEMDAEAGKFSSGDSFQKLLKMQMGS